MAKAPSYLPNHIQALVNINNDSGLQQIVICSNKVDLTHTNLYIKAIESTEFAVFHWDEVCFQEQYCLLEVHFTTEETKTYTIPTFQQTIFFYAINKGHINSEPLFLCAYFLVNHIKYYKIRFYITLTNFLDS